MMELGQNLVGLTGQNNGILRRQSRRQMHSFPVVEHVVEHDEDTFLTVHVRAFYVLFCCLVRTFYCLRPISEGFVRSMLRGIISKILYYITNIYVMNVGDGLRRGAILS